jgi:UPF0716 protein FxsA
MPALLVILFIVVPLLELVVIIQVGQLLGVLPTMAILVFDSVAGAILLSAQGRTAWRRFTETMAEGRVPHREVVDGALIIFGGALLLTPGFLTDVLGLLLLIPPTRAAFRGVLVAMFSKRFAVGVTVWRAAGRRRDSRSAGRREDDIEGSTVEDDPERLSR